MIRRHNGWVPFTIGVLNRERFSRVRNTGQLALLRFNALRNTGQLALLRLHALRNTGQLALLRLHATTDKGWVSRFTPTDRVIEAATGNVIREFDLPKIPIDLQLNRSGDLLAVEYRGLAQDIAKIVVLNIETGEELQTWTDGPLLTPVFSATGDWLAIMRPGKSNRLTVYETKTWEPIWTHETSHAPATAIDISSDFRKLALSLADTRIELWDLRELGMPAE